MSKIVQIVCFSLFALSAALAESQLRMPNDVNSRCPPFWSFEGMGDVCSTSIMPYSDDYFASVPVDGLEEIRNLVRPHPNDPFAAIRPELISPQALARNSAEHDLDMPSRPRVEARRPVERTTDNAAEMTQVSAVIQDWARAWSRRDIDTYLSFYSAEFGTGESGFNLQQWKEQRRGRINKPRKLSVTVRDVLVQMSGPDLAEARFVQDYRSDVMSESIRKVVRLRREDGRWHILAERAQ